MKRVSSFLALVAAALTLGVVPRAFAAPVYSGVAINMSDMAPGGSFQPVSQAGFGTRTYGDTYSAALLAQNTTSAFYISTGPNPTNTVYDGASAAYGNNSIT